MELLTLELTRGYRAVMDAAMFESPLTYNRRNGQSFTVRVCDLSWTAARNRNYWYATAHRGTFLFPLHRLLTQAPANLLVDHRDGDTMNNRLDNLRVCTHSQNARNCRKYKRGASRFKGVRRGYNGNGWVAQWHWRENGIGRSTSLGRFATEEEAARCYDAKAIEVFGEFARLNFPNEVTAS